jgi:hypothetical protein
MIRGFDRVMRLLLRLWRGEGLEVEGMFIRLVQDGAVEEGTVVGCVFLQV